MANLEFLRKIMNRRRELREERDSFSRQRNIEKQFSDKQMSSEERELLAFREADRVKKIKAEVKKIRAQKDRRFWSSADHNPVHAPNVTTGDKKLFSGRGSMFSQVPDVVNNDKNLFVNQRNMFANTNNIFVSKGGKKI